MSMAQAPELRIDDARRNEVVEQLQQHMAAGRLTPAEFEDRMGRALEAKTESQLAPLLADLPSLPARRRRRRLMIAGASLLVTAVIVTLVGITTPLFNRSTPAPTATSVPSLTVPRPTIPAPTTAAPPATATPAPQPTQPATATVTPAPTTVTVTAAPPTQTVTAAPPTHTVTAVAPTQTVTAAPQPTSTASVNRCPFPSPMSPPQFAEAGAACAWGKTEYCDCVNYA